MSLVLCEGLHDIMFVKNFIEDNSRLKVDEYTGKENERRHQQKNYMKSFPHMPEDVLAKGDSGKDFQDQIYVSLLVTINDLFPDHALLLDLDTGRPENRYKNIKNRISSRYGEGQKFNFDFEILDENEYFFYIEFHGNISHMDFQTPAIAFKKNLEQEAGVTDDDNKDEIENKIIELSREDSIEDFLKEHFLPKL